MFKTNLRSHGTGYKLPCYASLVVIPSDYARRKHQEQTRSGGVFCFFSNPIFYLKSKLSK